MLLRATVTDSAFGLEPWDSLLANKRRATKRGELTPHMRGGLGVETLDSGADSHLGHDITSGHEDFIMLSTIEVNTVVALFKYG